MARKKNQDSLPNLTLGTREDTQLINASDLEAQETTLLKEEDSDKETAESKALSQESDQQDSEATLTAQAEVKAQPEAPKKASRSRKQTATQATTEEAHANATLLPKDLKVLKESVNLTMNTMVTQFKTVEELTSQMNGHLEKMHLLIREMSPNQNPNLEELVKPAINSQFITKFATAASLAAMLLSILSMSLSQSARQTILSVAQKQKEFSSTQVTLAESHHVSPNKEELAVANHEGSSKKRLRK